MFFFKKKNNHYTNLLVGIALIIAIGFLAVFIANLDKSKGRRGESTKKEQTITEGSELLNQNKEALERAQTAGAGELKKIDDTDYTLGDLSAPIELIVYSDFECPFCADFAQTVRTIREEFGDKVVVAYRHFPLTAVHYNALTAAIASECAGEEEKFWEMHDKLFEDNLTDRMSAVQFKKDAEGLGLDMVKFNQCLDTEKYKDKVMSQMLEGRNAGVNGTPTTFLNGQLLPGAYPFEDFTDSGGYARKGMRSLIERVLEANSNL